MQKARAASWHSGDEDWPSDGGLRETLRTCAPFLDQAQPRFQQRLQPDVHQKPAEWMQVRFFFQARDEDAQRLFDRRIAEILKPSTVSRSRAQCFAIEEPQPLAGFIANIFPRGSPYNLFTHILPCMLNAIP